MGSDGNIELLGFNSDILIQGKTFHVQTEIFGDPPPATIRTSVYHRGFLIKKISFDCSELIHSDNFAEILEEKVKQQHNKAVADLKQGDIPIND